MYQIPSPLLAHSQRVCTQDADLLRDIAHNGQEAGREHASTSIVNKLLDIAETIAWPPGLHVVVAPNEGHDDGEGVFNLDDKDEDDGGELTIPVEMAEWHKADEIGDDA